MNKNMKFLIIVACLLILSSGCLNSPPPDGQRASVELIDYSIINTSVVVDDAWVIHFMYSGIDEIGMPEYTVRVGSDSGAKTFFNINEIQVDYNE